MENAIKSRYEIEPSRPTRDEKGLFLKGCPPGPGRPKGSVVDFMEVVRRKVEETGGDLDAMVWGALQGLARKAANGDSAAAKVLLDRLCGTIDKGVAVNVGVNTAPSPGRPVGPPMPSGIEFGDYIKKLNQVAAAQGLLGNATPDQIVDEAIEAAATEDAAIEELLQ